jgi:ribosomal protein S6
VSEIKKDIEGFGGEVKRAEKPEKRGLSYPIKKYKSAHFVLLGFSFGPSNIQELSSLLKQRTTLLRHLISHPIAAKPARSTRKPATSPTGLSADKAGLLRSETSEAESPKSKQTGKKKIKKEVIKKEEIKVEEIDKKLDEILGT